jgi:hypothetical protein
MGTRGTANGARTWEETAVLSTMAHAGPIVPTRPRALLENTAQLAKGQEAAGRANSAVQARTPRLPVRRHALRVALGSF